MLSALILWPWLVALWLAGRAQDSHRLAVPAALFELLLALAVLFGADTPDSRALHLPLLGYLWYLQNSSLGATLAVTAAALLSFALLFAWRLEEFRGFTIAALVLVGALMGTFFSQNFLGFYLFYEIVALSGAWMILIGGDRDRAAALRFLLYTVGGSLLLLVAVLYLYLRSGNTNGIYSFSWTHLAAAAAPDPDLAWWLFLAMLAGLAVKLPLFPLHSWAGPAYGRAAPPASMLLSGAAVLAGAYGLIHWAIPLLPLGALHFAPYGILLGAIGTLYAAFLALDAPNLRRFAAWVSVSHMNLVAIGLFALQEQAVHGALFLLVAHAVLAAGLFGVIAILEARGLPGHWDALGGLFRQTPQLGAWMLFFFLTGMGLPGLANFPGEFLSLAGAFRVSPWPAAIAALGILLSVVVFLRAYERVMLGPLNPGIARGTGDLAGRELALLWALGLLCLWLGLDPQPLLGQFQGLLPVHSAVLFGGVVHGH
jgi:NADH-quinone oxidoreductase subunit M